MKWKQMAFSFLREAKSDLHAAEVLAAEKEFARSIEHSQHAVEKAIKAALFMKNISVTNEHFVAEIFEKNFSEHPGVKGIVAKAQALENEGTLTEYPVWDPATGSVASPYEEYDQETAQKFYSEAHWIFHQIASYLKHVYQITLPES